MTFQQAMAETGYKTITTFWDDFTIADQFGGGAVLDTYQRAFNEWANNTKYVTELSLVLNHKIAYHYQRHNMALAKLYNNLWNTTHDYCLDNLKGDDLNYYYRVTD